MAGSFPPMKCGIGDYTRYLAQALANEPGVKVGVLTSTQAGASADGKKFEVLPVMKRWKISEVATLARNLRAWKPDIVHVQYPTQGYLGGSLHWFIPLVCFFLRRPVVQTWHEPYSVFPMPLRFLMSVVPTRIVVVRPAYLTLLSYPQRLALLGRNVTFIPNASSLPALRLSDEERRDLRTHYLKGQQRLLVYYGFVYPHKGIELLFLVADPARDQLVIAGEIPVEDPYGAEIRQLASAPPWLGRATIVGFLPVAEVVQLLAVADAVVLPYRLGGGEWNTSIHGAVLQRTFVLTTSVTQRGYDKKRNVYYAEVGDVEDMKAALCQYAGVRRALDPEVDRDEWPEIARKHHALYSRFVSHAATSRDVS